MLPFGSHSAPPVQRIAAETGVRGSKGCLFFHFLSFSISLFLYLYPYLAISLSKKEPCSAVSLRPQAPVGFDPVPCTLQPTPYTLQPTPYNLHPKPSTLNTTPYTLNPKH